MPLGDFLKIISKFIYLSHFFSSSSIFQSYRWILFLYKRSENYKCCFFYLPFDLIIKTLFAWMDWFGLSFRAPRFFSFLSLSLWFRVASRWRLTPIDKSYNPLKAKQNGHPRAHNSIIAVYSTFPLRGNQFLDVTWHPNHDGPWLSVFILKGGKGRKHLFYAFFC